MQGQLFPSEHSRHVDELTGRTVHQMTAHASINHAPYFLQSAFTPDGKTLIFTSYRTGCAQLYEIDFPEGPIRQLTNGRAVHPFSAAIHPNGRSVYFVRGAGVWVVDRMTMMERQITDFGGAQLGECSLSRDGIWLAAAIKNGEQNGIAVGRADGSEWRILDFPRTVIHPQFHPINPEWLIFSGDPAPRMHRVRRDGSGLECLYEHDNEVFVVHETFLGDTGDLVFTIWPKTLNHMSWDSCDQRQIAELNAWHIAPDRAGRRVLADTNHPDRGIVLIDTATGEYQPVCLSQSSNQGSQWAKSSYALKEDFDAAWGKKKPLSWMEVPIEPVYGPQWTHPHPSFSPDEKLVVFTSDRTGHPQVYVAELE